MNRRLFSAALCALALTTAAGFAQAAGEGAVNPRPSPDRVWTLVDALPQERAGAEPMVRPQVAQLLMLDAAAMQRQLELAPMEFTQESITRPVFVSLPMPDGTFQRFSIVETDVMHPELAAKFPEIKTYTGVGIDEDASTVRLDMTPHGFRAMVLAPSGSVFIDPWTKFDVTQYSSYYKRDYMGREAWLCEADTLPENMEYERRMAERFGLSRDSQREEQPGNERAAAGLRTYRLANAATGEYTAFFGGTVPAGQAAIVTAVNRVTGVYERELGVRLQLVANNSSIVYTNSATDPYTNGNGGTMLGQNQTNCDTVIGSANYDIGHVFSTGGGGVATLNAVCSATNKARGVTGSGAPTGDAFWIDYVAHEMGHQFGGSHTFNGSIGACSGGNRSAANAYEPGSGSTIQAYAGICGSDDLQPNSDAYFHFESLRQMSTFINAGGACRTFVTNGNNTPTVTVTSPAGLTIPANTPFELVASGNDSDGNPITYCWEQRNLGGALTLAGGDNGFSPICRSFNPTTNNVRTVPQLATILAGGTTSLGNILPTTTRNMSWRVTVRDNIATGGGYGFADYSFQTTNAAGPFTVSSNNSPGGSFTTTMTVTWNVANTNLAPVSAANVDIFLSTDGGNTFPTLLVNATPNDGSQLVSLPSVNTTTARIKVQGDNSIFFDINNANFTITPVPPPGPFNLTSPANGASGVALPVTLTWAGSAGATSYTVEVDTDFSFILPLVYSTSTVATNQPIPGGTLTDNTTYYWRVIANNGASTTGNPNPSVFTTATPPSCPGDFDGSGTRDTVDLVFFLGQFGQAVPPGTGGDLDGNGTVNTVDLVTFLALFGVPCP
ncbi:MAG: reprolysin-like metallopeptidase [Phycisphaerales bacterium]